MKAEEFDAKFDTGEDITEFLDLSIRERYFGKAAPKDFLRD